MDADNNPTSTSTDVVCNKFQDPVAFGDASVSSKSEVIVDASGVHTTDLEILHHISCESVTINIDEAANAKADRAIDLKDLANDVDPNSEDIELKWEDDNDDEEECLADKEMPELIAVESEVKTNSSDVMEVDEANQLDDNKISDTGTPVINDSNDKTMLSENVVEGHDSDLNNIVNNPQVRVENLGTNEITDATNINSTLPLDTQAVQSTMSDISEKNMLNEAVTTEVSHVSELMTEENSRNSEISTVEEDLVIENPLPSDEINECVEKTEENAIKTKDLSNVCTDTSLSKVFDIKNTEHSADPEDKTSKDLPVSNKPKIENINFDSAIICDEKEELDIFNHMVFDNEVEQNTVPSINEQKLDDKDDKPTQNIEDSHDVESFLNSSDPINSVPNEIESDIDKILESEILDDNNESQKESEGKIMDDITSDITSTSNSSKIVTAQEEYHNNLKEKSNNDDIDKTAKTVMSQILPSTSNITDDTKNTQVVDESLLPAINDITEEAMTDETQEISTSAVSDKEPIPSTSAVSINDMSPDASDEIPEVTDSLGLLAESTMRVIDEEDEEDDDGDDEEFDGDDADDAGYDESTVTPEHSEDSNAQISENETSKEPVVISADVTFTGKLTQIEAEGEMEKEAAQKEIVDKGGEGEVVEDKEVLESMSVDVTPEKCDEKKLLESVKENEKHTRNKSDRGTNDTAERADVELEKVSGNTDIEAVFQTDDVVQNEVIVTTETKESASEVLDESDASMTDKERGNSQSDSPSKLKNLKITRNVIRSVLNIVDLEESSSEDDIQEIRKAAEEIYDDSDNSSDKNKQVERQDSMLSELLKAPPMKMTRLNTGEVTIKTSLSSVPKLVIPEVDTSKQDTNKSESAETKCGSEIVTLYSDEEEPGTAEVKDRTSPAPAQESPPTDTGKRRRCVNPDCTGSDPALSPTPDVLRFYNVKRKRKALVCQNCSDVVTRRALLLMEGVKSMMPLLELDMSRPVQSLVEISDSDSDEEGTSSKDDTIFLGGNVEMLEKELADVINGTWSKYDLEDRLEVAKTDIETQLEEFERDCKEINDMLRECQRNTDAVRRDLYATFAQRTHQLTPLDIYDTPQVKYTKLLDKDYEAEVRRSKRPRGQTNGSTSSTPIDVKEEPMSSELRAAATKPVEDDGQDISVVQLCVERAPSGLPRAGAWARPALQAGAAVLAMRHAFGAWQRARVLELYPRPPPSTNTQFTMCKVKFEARGVIANISARHIAYSEVAPVRLTMGARVIALFKDTTGRSIAKRGMSYYSGVIAEPPNPVNNYRYLVFFDDGYAQYVPHGDIRAVVECSSLVWEEVHPFSREFVRLYLLHYPERPMVRLHAGQTLKTEWNGKWWVSKVVEVDASLVKVYFEADRRTEWIYRGSTRLAPLFLELRAAERARGRPAPRHKHSRQNMPYVEYTRTDEQETSNADAQKQEEIKSQRAVAKKSTATPPIALPSPAHDPGVTSRVVYYTPRAAVRPLALSAHACSARCQRADVLPLRELRTYNPLARPLLSGWERQIVKFKGRKEIMYRAPCGRRLRNMSETHKYLRLINSEMSVDLFDFALNTHCLAEFVLNKCLVSKKDLSHGKENVPVPCVNYFDNSLPEFCSYNTERTPTAGVPLNLDPDFLCGCDCEDDCIDKSKCDCWKLTLTGAKTIGMDGDEVGYVYKRLLEPVPSGIYECNSRCKCKQTCLNRVAQHPLQLKLQVFKTQNRGWGIRALNDVPRGAFLCVYAGNLLTDATANLDGLNEGDEYLAELDYIEVVEQMKEGYEEDIPAADKKLDEEESNSESEEESLPSDDEKKVLEDDDFKPAYDIPKGVLEFKKRLRKREKIKKEKESAAEKDRKEAEKDRDTEIKREEDCITISDDEEVREPQSFSAQTGMGGNDLVSKYRSVRSFFGKDEACYIMDAKVQGNIGRYLNHSCTPNVFVQNVFVDTHDPRFPWVSFFALTHIKAGAELTWNYNYDVGSVPGKTLYCYCGASNCRGRLL